MTIIQIKVEEVKDVFEVSIQGLLQSHSFLAGISGLIIDHLGFDKYDGCNELEKELINSLRGVVKCSKKLIEEYGKELQIK